jgi:mono/diheme cytochrome c family protein
MSNMMDSPQRNRQHNDVVIRSKRRLGDVGCVVVFVLLMIGVGAATVVWGPDLLNRLANQTAAPYIGLSDHTSPEQLEIHRAQQLAQLNDYGWIDQEAGVARIPIHRAIDLLAERGLPVGGASADGATVQEEPATDAPVDLATVNYQDHVLPIFEQHCAECHGAEDPEEGLELTRYRTAIVGSMNGPVIEPGDPDNSYLVELIVNGDMPKRGDPLSPGEIEIIIAWIEAGAPEN